MIFVVAPACSRAFFGSVISTCSKSSVTKMATRSPFNLFFCMLILPFYQTIEEFQAYEIAVGADLSRPSPPCISHKRGIAETWRNGFQVPIYRPLCSFADLSAPTDSPVCSITYKQFIHPGFPYVLTMA